MNESSQNNVAYDHYHRPSTNAFEFSTGAPAISLCGDATLHKDDPKVGSLCPTCLGMYGNLNSNN
jgi:hypothetical protein